METNFNQLEQIPTSLMKDITSDEIKLDEMTGNTPSATDAPPVTFTPAQTSGAVPGFDPYAQPGPQSQQLNAGNLISAELAVNLLDQVVPVIFVLIFKKYYNKTVSKKQIQLSAAEKDTIKPVLQNYLNSVNFSVEKPLDALIITFGFIYGMKFIEVNNDTPSGNFKTVSNATGIGEPTATGSIKRDGRGRPKGSTKKI